MDVLPVWPYVLCVYSGSRGQWWILYAIQDTLISKMMVVVMVTMLTTVVKTSTDGTQ